MGGDCCVPIAVRKKDNTIKSLAKLVAIKINEGANTSKVRITTIFRVLTKSPGSVGAVSVKSTVGIVGGVGVGSAPRSNPMLKQKTKSNRNTKNSLWVALRYLLGILEGFLYYFVIHHFLIDFFQSHVPKYFALCVNVYHLGRIETLRAD